MLLRRIIKHVRHQDWTAIAIDFVIVVVGVFIGIQVSNWNDERLRAQTEQQYMERIKADLRANKSDFRQRLEYFGRVRQHALDALEVIEGPVDSLGEQFVVDVYQASHKLQRAFGRDTYDEVLSVGANNAISDVAVRERLSNFYRSIQAQLLTLEIVPPYREIVRRNFPYGVSSALREQCGDLVTTGANGEPYIKLPEQCEPQLSDDQVAQTIRNIKALDLQKDLTRRITNLDTKLWAIQLILDRIELLETDIAGL